MTPACIQLTRQRTVIHITTDASGIGLGASWGDRWSVWDIPFEWSFAFNARQSSASLEARAILSAVLTWQHLWPPGSIICIKNDNAAAVQAFTARHSPVPDISDAIRIAFQIAINLHLAELLVSWIPGETNLRADALSRKLMPVFRALTPQADILASHPRKPRGTSWLRWTAWRIIS